MSVGKAVLTRFTRFLFYTLLVILVDVMLIVVLEGEIAQLTGTLSFVLLVEGGLGLAAGGAVVLYSPSVAKVREVLFHSEPWNAKRQKQVERQMKTVIATGALLVVESLLLSAV